MRIASLGSQRAPAVLSHGPRYSSIGASTDFPRSTAGKRRNGTAGWLPLQETARNRAAISCASGVSTGVSGDEDSNRGVSAANLSQLAKRIGEISDSNQLQTVLAAAIAAEDYKLAASVRDRLSEVRQ
jgi:hypothetical protein